MFILSFVRSVACMVHLCNQKHSVHVFCGLTAEVKLVIVMSL